MNYDNIPHLIKDTGQFCCWRYELRKGRKTKVPYNPITRNRASVDKPETFVGFKTAIDAVANYDGIGIRVNGRIIGIDLDHCVVDGQILPWAKEIVECFSDTYIEISPSGIGIRILALMLEGYTYDTSTYYIKKGNIVVVKHFCNSTTYIFKNDIELHKEFDNHYMNVACHGCTNHRQILQWNF